jgi:hypothetical protein
MLAVPAFIETVANTFGAERAFDVKRLPPIWRVAPPTAGTVPTPTTPEVP